MEFTKTIKRYCLYLHGLLGLVLIVLFWDVHLSPYHFFASMLGISLIGAFAFQFRLIPEWYSNSWLIGFLSGPWITLIVANALACIILALWDHDFAFLLSAAVWIGATVMCHLGIRGTMKGEECTEDELY